MNICFYFCAFNSVMPDFDKDVFRPTAISQKVHLDFTLSQLRLQISLIVRVGKNAEKGPDQFCCT